MDMFYCVICHHFQMFQTPSSTNFLSLQIDVIPLFWLKLHFVNDILTVHKSFGWICDFLHKNEFKEFSTLSWQVVIHCCRRAMTCASGQVLTNSCMQLSRLSKVEDAIKCTIIVLVEKCIYPGFRTITCKSGCSGVKDEWTVRKFPKTFYFF